MKSAYERERQLYGASTKDLIFVELTGSDSTGRVHSEGQVCRPEIVGLPGCSHNIEGDGAYVRMGEQTKAWMGWRQGIMLWSDKEQ